jgi:hypothetical protein
MRCESDIQSRIEEIKSKLLLINEKKGLELDKKFDERDYRLLRFLHGELSVYDFARLELEWVLSG